MGAETPLTMKRRTSEYSENEAWERFGDWLTGNPGSLLLEQELDCLEQLLGELFGYYLLQLGYPAGRPGILVGSRIRHHLILDPLGGSPQVHMIGDPAHLPVASDSVDVVLLQHGLDHPRPGIGASLGCLGARARHARVQAADAAQQRRSAR